MKSILSILLLSLLVIVTVQHARAQAPQLINFQAQIEGVTSGTVPVDFAIYDVATGGTALWSESYPNLAVQNGRIQVLLGSTETNGIPASVFETDGDRYIAITVNGNLLSPRSRLTSVAYALRASVADRVEGGGGGGGVTSLNTLTGAVNLEAGSNVSITPDGQNLRIDATGGGGTGGITTINAGAGIAVSDNDGPTTEISLAANAITDAYIADNSLTSGSLANNSVGAAEIASDAVGSDELQSTLVLGSNGRLDVQNASGQVRGSFTTLNGGGFLGLDSSDGDDGVTLEVLNGNAFGRVTVHNLTGLPGIRLAGDQTNPGLFGGSIAIFRRNGQNSAVWSRVEGSNATDAWGVIGVSDAANTEVIILDGQNGDISIAGNLSKGSGSFKIDHPLDPTNKYLSHSFVESPDMMNVYNGNVVLDENGEAWVELPEWFEALNSDFRYQLTCIGGFSPVYVADKIENNRFKIAGGSPNLEVSWQVTGIRNDPYAQLHRIQVEEEKGERDRGHYLHPDAYNASRINE